VRWSEATITSPGSWWPPPGRVPTTTPQFGTLKQNGRHVAKVRLFYKPYTAPCPINSDQQWGVFLLYWISFGYRYLCSLSLSYVNHKSGNMFISIR
jgi:hypothetical protein